MAVDLLLNAFAALGKPIHITEMGVNGGFRQKGNAGSSWSQMAMSEGTWHGGWNEHTQADWLEQFYTIAASRKEIQALTWWDLSSRASPATARCSTRMRIRVSRISGCWR